VAVSPAGFSGLVVLRLRADSRPTDHGRNVKCGWARDVGDDSVSLKIAISGHDMRVCVFRLGLGNPLRFGCSWDGAGHTHRYGGCNRDDNRRCSPASCEVELALNNEIMLW
jgi:hypothetical protein